MREIQGFLAEMYAVEVSPDLISTVTDGVVAEVTAWQSRPLEPMYPVVFFDALRVKIRDEATVRSKAIYLALAVLPDGTPRHPRAVDRADRRRQVLDEGLQRPEDARLPGHPDRGHRRPERHERGAGGGLSGDDAADLHRPSDSPQSRLRELERAQAAGDGAAADLHGAERRGGRARPWTPSSAGPWGTKFPTVVASWRRAWTHVIPFFAFPPEVRRVIYTTNALESVHAQLRKIIKTRGHFPTDEAATKLIWLALRNITAKWARASHDWRAGDESIRDSLRRSLFALDGVKCNARMDAAGAVDAQNAPTAPWKTAQNAVSHSAHTPHAQVFKSIDAHGPSDRTDGANPTDQGPRTKDGTRGPGRTRTKAGRTRNQGLWFGRLDDRFHVRQIFVERAAAGGGEPVFGPRHAIFEGLVAGDVGRFFQLAGVDAQVAVRGLQQTLQLVERQAIVHGERADDAEPEPLVNQPVERERRFLRGLPDR